MSLTRIVQRSCSLAKFSSPPRLGGRGSDDETKVVQIKGASVGSSSGGDVGKSSHVRLASDSQQIAHSALPLRKEAREACLAITRAKQAQTPMTSKDEKRKKTEEKKKRKRRRKKKRKKWVGGCAGWGAVGSIRRRGAVVIIRRLDLGSQW